MAFLNRLFGRRPAPVEPGAAPLAGPGSDLPAETMPPPVPIEPAENEPSDVAGPISLQQQKSQTSEAPPLKALYGYQKDPAFKNFQERLKRPPGMERRIRMPNLDYPPPASSTAPHTSSGPNSPATPATPHTTPKR